MLDRLVLPARNRSPRFSFAGILSFLYTSMNIHPFTWLGYFTLELEDTPPADADLLPARFPRLICTEMLVWDRSTPELWRAWDNELSNLLQIKQNTCQHTFIFSEDKQVFRCPCLNTECFLRTILWKNLGTDEIARNFRWENLMLGTLKGGKKTLQKERILWSL